MPSGAAAYARWSTRTVVVPIISGTREEIGQGAAVLFHECGHILAGDCRGGDHQRDPNVKWWHHCLKCEQLAWEKAMQLWPFNRTMFDRLRTVLESYRRGTDGPATAKAAVDRQRSTLTWAEDRQRRANYSIDALWARHRWNLMTAQEKFDHQVTEQKRRRLQMGRITK